MSFSTSPYRNKVIVIYNSLFFSELLCYMNKHDIETAIDESNTLWHIDDVKQILNQWKEPKHGGKNHRT